MDVKLHVHPLKAVLTERRHKSEIEFGMLSIICNLISL